MVDIIKPEDSNTTIVVRKLTDEDLTEQKLDGNGTFDKLMRTVTAHLEDQYDKNRIVGDQFATVYLGSLSEVLQQSVLFLLERDKAWLANELAKKQIELAEQELALKAIQIENEKKQGQLHDAQIALIWQKVDTEKAQTQGKIDDKPVSGLVGSQIKLYEQQRLGFQRDAESKFLKIMTDTWITRKTVDEGTPLPSGMDTQKLEEYINNTWIKVDKENSVI